MKATREEVEAIVLRALSYITSDEARVLSFYEPEAIAAFVAHVERIGPSREIEEPLATRLTCRHCGCEDTTKFTYFYAETATYHVSNESEGERFPDPHIRQHEGSREVHDGIGSVAGYLHCDACGRETLIPAWVERSFELY